MRTYDLKPITTASWPPPTDHNRLYAGDGLLVAELRGDIDLAAAIHASPWLDSVAALHAPLYVIDLRAVSFMDSAGLNLVLRFRRRVLASGATLGVLCPPRTLRLLHAHGTLGLLRPATTLDEAVARATAADGARDASCASWPLDRP